jgi:hypothetical protein
VVIAKLEQLDVSRVAGNRHQAGFAERHPGLGHTIAGSVARDPWNGRRERVGLVGDKDAARVDSCYVISSLEGW